MCTLIFCYLKGAHNICYSKQVNETEKHTVATTGFEDSADADVSSLVFSFILFLLLLSSIFIRGPGQILMHLDFNVHHRLQKLKASRWLLARC